MKKESCERCDGRELKPIKKEKPKKEFVPWDHYSECIFCITRGPCTKHVKIWHHAD